MLYNNEPIEYAGIYRGMVVDNYDPEIKGRVKIYVPGIYPKELAKTPDMLPWSEPVMPIFGGSWTNERKGDLNIETGVSTIPHTSKIPLDGAQVWVFFEQGDQNWPKYFGVSQAGPGWLSEHNNQHVIKTDNVRVRIDEDPNNEKSTCQFDTYNAKNTYLGKKHLKKKQPTRVDVEIWNKPGIALNLIIKGDVNIKVEGDVHEEITGNKYETLKGNLYRQHDGDVHIVHKGCTVIDENGKRVSSYKGNHTKVHSGDNKKILNGNNEKTITKSNNLITQGIESLTTFGGKVTNVAGQMINSVAGAFMNAVSGEDITFQKKKALIFDGDIIIASKKGDVYIQALQNGKKVLTKASIIESKAGIIMLDETAGTIQHNYNPAIIVDKPEYS